MSDVRSPSDLRLRCPDCRGALVGHPPQCTKCERIFELYNDVALLLPRMLLDDAELRQHMLYDGVAHEYDSVFPKHIASHYLHKRTRLIRDLIRPGGIVLDVGCGTGQLGAAIAAEGYNVFGADLSPNMVAIARTRGLAGAYAAVGTALPFADESFDVVVTVATLHHLETPERVAATIKEMGRVVRTTGFIVLWDHNPANPYWPFLMKRVPQDSGEERLVPLDEILDGVGAAGLNPVRVFRSGFTPDFMPRALVAPWRWVERTVEITPGLNMFAAHNVVVARRRPPVAL